MEHALDLVTTVTGCLAAALVFGLASQRLRLSPIVGYLIAGVVVGPFSPGFVARADVAAELAEIGIILLMFGVGLHFHVKELSAVKHIAVPGALAQIALATALGAVVGCAAGWSFASGIVFGLAVSVASTVVLLRVLADAGALHTPSGHVAVGWLLVEDAFTVVVLVLLPIVAGRASGGAAAMSIAVACAKIIALVAFTWLVGRKAIPKLLASVARTRSRELFTLTVLVVALGIAVAAAKLFGVSMPLGAFLAGMVVGQSELSTRAASEALPMRDAFAVLFFVSTGMLLDPAALVPNAGIIAGTLAVVLIGKPLAALAVVLVLGRSANTAATVAIALAQIGESSFVVAALGRELAVLPASATQALVAVAIVSITMSPLAFRQVDRLARVLPARRRFAEASPAAEPDAGDDAEERAIVVGYGPIGRTLVKLLRDSGVAATVIELNHQTVRELRAAGVRAIYGDAAQREVLEQAGVRRARSLIFAASGAPDAVVRQATALHGDILIMSRATYLGEVPALERAGARVVVSAEAEVALAMTEQLLARLGASAEQLDRARARVRGELGG